MKLNLGNRHKRTLIAALIVALVMPVIIKDAVQLSESMSFPTPWYSTNWFLNPVTNLYLAFHDSKEYTTTNAAKTERWRVREVKVGESVFWTALERKSI